MAAPSARRTIRTVVTVLSLLTAAGCSSTLGDASGPAIPSPTAVATTTPSPVATPGDAATPVPSAPTGGAAEGSAVALLSALPLKGKSPLTGYDRVGDFGRAWTDVDRNGCDTRDDVLARDLTAITRPGSCRVLAGTLVTPYTGETIHFVRGETTSALVQIDHLVALANAWQTGAQSLSASARLSLANDPLNLLAVDGRSNSAKGAGDTATWLPANTAFRCEYVARQVSVKAAYGLWVTAAERDAMARVLSGCPGQRAMYSTLMPPAAAPRG